MHIYFLIINITLKSRGGLFLLLLRTKHRIYELKV